MWDPLALMEHARSLGDIVRMKLLGMEAVLLHHPEHIDYVLRAQHMTYVKGGPFWSSASAVLGNGLPVSDGEVWRSQRRMIQPQFHPRRLADLTRLIHRTLVQSLDWPEVGSAWQSVDVGPRMQHLTMDVVAAAIFGSRVTRASSLEVGAAFRRIVHGMVWVMLAHGLPWFPGQRGFERAVGEVRRHVQAFVDERRASRDRDSCLLGWMIAATDNEGGTRMSDAQLLDETLSMFIAGFETTASGLTWALHFLADQPEHLARIREQADANLQGEPDAEAAGRLTYARWVMQEALRLYPPVWWLPRIAQRDDTLGGYAIPRGTMVAPVLYTAQRHPAVWSDPDRFDPQRFSPERSAGRHPRAFMPFGLGPRGCVGHELALLESQLALSLIAQRFDLAKVAGKRPSPRATMLLRPSDGALLQLRRRAATKASDFALQAAGF